MKKALRYLITAALIFSILLSTLYIVMYAEHECSLDDCCICERIEAAFGIIRSLMGGAAALCSVVLLAIIAFGRIASASCAQRHCQTPVILKVRLDN